MIGGSLPNMHFQTFYVSKEESNCPLIASTLKVKKNIKEHDISDIVISQRYGKRILINSSNKTEETRNDFLEIVDYDPIKKVILAMGPNEPRIEAPLHWFIHHARDEVNSVIQINDRGLSDRIKDIPETENDYPIASIEQIKEVLKCLKNSNRIVIRNHGVIFIGKNIDEVEKLVLEEIK